MRSRLWQVAQTWVYTWWPRRTLERTTNRTVSRGTPLANHSSSAGKQRTPWHPESPTSAGATMGALAGGCGRHWRTRRHPARLQTAPQERRSGQRQQAGAAENTTTQWGVSEQTQHGRADTTAAGGGCGRGHGNRRRAKGPTMHNAAHGMPCDFTRQRMRAGGAKPQTASSSADSMTYSGVGEHTGPGESRRA